jgi:hypothetical protein
MKKKENKKEKLKKGKQKKPIKLTFQKQKTRKTQNSNETLSKPQKPPQNLLEYLQNWKKNTTPCLRCWDGPIKNHNERRCANGRNRHLIERAKSNGLFEGVIPHLVDGRLSILQYADDTIFFYGT